MCLRRKRTESDMQNWQLVVNVAEAYSFYRLHLYMWSEGKFSNLCGYWTVRALKGVKHTRPCNEHNPPMCTPPPSQLTHTNTYNPRQSLFSRSHGYNRCYVPYATALSDSKLCNTYRLLKGFIFTITKDEKKLPNHGCCGEFYEVVTMLRSNLLISTSGEDALDLFMALTQEIRQYQ